ncbi:MAG: hypothetical protein K2O01_04140, partial [Bacteroidales bacterium]|nr:hypothetical protein [Bacteroidales bacterium]
MDRTTAMKLWGGVLAACLAMVLWTGCKERPGRSGGSEAVAADEASRWAAVSDSLWQSVGHA